MSARSLAPATHCDSRPTPLGGSRADGYRVAMKYCAALLVSVLAACGNDGNSDHSDAGPRADAPPSCPAPATPLAAGEHKLYASFEGVTLTLGDCDDARTNCSSLVSQASTMVPPFLMGQGTRAGRITTIVGMVQEALAPFSIDVVTTRPASGSYWMVSVGGDALTLVTGSSDPLMAMKPVCDAANKNSIALVFEQDDTEFGDRAYADSIAGAFGQLAGLLSIGRNGDCMCTAATCTHGQTCTWSTGAVPAAGNACSRTSQNEHLLLIDAVGCR
jgi:hypothetical protein